MTDGDIAVLPSRHAVVAMSALWHPAGRDGPLLGLSSVLHRLRDVPSLPSRGRGEPRLLRARSTSVAADGRRDPALLGGVDDDPRVGCHPDHRTGRASATDRGRCARDQQPARVHRGRRRTADRAAHGGRGRATDDPTRSRCPRLEPVRRPGGLSAPCCGASRTSIRAPVSASVSGSAPASVSVSARRRGRCGGRLRRRGRGRLRGRCRRRCGRSGSAPVRSR